MQFRLNLVVYQRSIHHKTRKTMQKLLSIALVLTIGLTACQKEAVDVSQEADDDKSTQFENLLTLDEGIVDELYVADAPESFPPAPCATVTRDTTTTPRTITIDYGTTNCLCVDGRFRRGVVVISYTGQRRQLGSSYSVAFTNYFVNDNAVAGSISGSYSLNNGNPFITRNSSLTLTDTANQVRTRTANRTIEMIAGFGTPVRSDDVFLINGSSSTSNSRFSSTQTITTPLRKELSCNWLVSGVMTTTRGTQSRTIDFGNGTCDNQATVTTARGTRTITLP